jgi:hypothetical protein
MPMKHKKRYVEMIRTHPSKTILVERIIIAWALLATVAYCVQKATVNYTFNYGFLSRPATESRYEDLALTLPNIGKAFYIADPVADQSAEAELNRNLLAKYFLAPYLTPDADAPYEVTDLHHPVDLQQWAKDHQRYIIRDFQNGVALLKKKDNR